MAVYFNNSFSTKKEYTLQIEEMRGVDLSNSPLFVDKSHASDMSNFIMENNVLQKRFGWREVFQFKDHINGFWQFETSKYVDNAYEVTKHCIVMVGTEFYEIIGLHTDNTTAIKIAFGSNVDATKIKDAVAYGVVGGEKLYILCGDFLTLGYYGDSFEIHRVEDDEQTFIPTTTISIAAIGNNNISRSPYDDINLMTRYRYNTLLGESENTTLTEFSYILDGVCSDLSSVEVSVRNSNNGYDLLSKDTDYTIENTTYENIQVTKITFTSNHTPIIEGQDNYKVKFAVYDSTNSDKINNCNFGCLYGYDNVLDRLFFSGNPQYPNVIFRSTESTSNDQQDFTYFSANEYIKCGNTTNSIKGMTILGDGTLAVLKTPSGQEPTIYFINAMMITATDREGNAIYVNGEAQIEEAYRVQVGTIGEGLVNTSSLQTLAGDNLMLSYNGVFGIVLGDNVASSQRYAKSRSRLINGALTKNKEKLANATCIVFDNKFYLCIDDVCYVADGRYPYKLKDDLNGTYQYEWYKWDNIPARLFFSYDNELYFGTTDGHICVFENKNFVDTTYAEINEGELTYDSENELFVINRTRVQEIERLHDNDIMHLRVDDPRLYALFLNKEDFDIDMDNNAILIKKELSHDYIVQMSAYMMYIDNIAEDSDTELVVDTPYYIEIEGSDDLTQTIDLDTYYGRAKLYEAIAEISEGITIYSRGNEINLGSLNDFRICYQLGESNIITEVQGTVGDDVIKYREVEWNGNEYERYDNMGNIIATYTKEDLIFNKFKIKTYTSEASTHTIVHYKNIVQNVLSAKFEFNNSVLCYYVSSVFDLGSVVYAKNLKSLIIVPDTLLDTEVEFGYETKRDSRMFSAYTGSTFSFDKLDFDNLSFESEGFAKAYVKRCREKNFNYIRFIFRNSSNNNCKLSNLTVVYEYGRKNKGVA